MNHTPNSKLVRTVDAASEPLALDDALNYCRIQGTSSSNDSALVQSMITAARLECERINNRSFINTTWCLTLDYFPPYSARFSSLLPPAIVGGYSDRNYWLNLSDIAIQLPMPPLISVSSITYIDTNGNLQSMDVSPDAHQITISPGTPGQIIPYYGKIFPITQPTISAVNITYVAGFGADASDVPQNIIHAMRLLVSHYYENRMTTVPTPQQVYDLLDCSYWGGYA